jgi:hypothetical protein
MPMLNYTTYFDDTEVANAAHPYGDRYDGWVVTSELWESLGQGIVLPINPERLSISAPLRGHEYEAVFGKAAYSGFNKRKRTHFDAFNLQLTFNSGYIIPKASLGSISSYKSGVNQNTNTTDTSYRLGGRMLKSSESQDIGRAYPLSGNAEATGFYKSKNTEGSSYTDLSHFGVNVGFYDPKIPVGTQNLYAVLALIDGPKTWRPDLGYSDPFAMAAPNRIKVYANSLVFPAMTFYCLALDGGVSWAESAESPTSFDMTVNLLCTATDPMLGRAQLGNLVSSYKTNFTMGTLSRFSARNQSTYRSSASNDGTEF